MELSGDLSTPYAKAHLIHDCGSCCLALSHRLSQRLHDYMESSPNKMYAHADGKDGEVSPSVTGRHPLLTAISFLWSRRRHISAEPLCAKAGQIQRFVT